MNTNDQHQQLTTKLKRVLMDLHSVEFMIESAEDNSNIIEKHILEGILKELNQVHTQVLTMFDVITGENL